MAWIYFIPLIFSFFFSFFLYFCVHHFLSIFWYFNSDLSILHYLDIHVGRCCMSPMIQLSLHPSHNLFSSYPFFFFFFIFFVSHFILHLVSIIFILLTPSTPLSSVYLNSLHDLYFCRYSILH